MGWAPTSREAGEGLGTGGRGGRGPVLSVEAGLGQGWEKRGERDGRRGRSTARERLSRWQSSRMEDHSSKPLGSRGARSQTIVDTPFAVTGMWGMNLEAGFTPRSS